MNLKDTTVLVRMTVSMYHIVKEDTDMQLQFEYFNRDVEFSVFSQLSGYDILMLHVLLSVIGHGISTCHVRSEVFTKVTLTNAIFYTSCLFSSTPL
jgi:hypothetical protein